MAIQTTGLMKQQLMQQPTDITPQTAMDGGVTRTSMAGDLMKAMNDIDFRQLMQQYAAMSGQASARPMTDQFMKDERTKFGGDEVFTTPVINPNSMLQNSYSNMPVVPDNFSNAPGIKDEERENMGLMKPQPMGV